MYLTPSVCKVVFQTSISVQIREIILYYCRRQCGSRRVSRGLRWWTLLSTSSLFIVQKVFIKLLCKGLFPYKFINIFFTITNVQERLTNLCGNWLLKWAGGSATVDGCLGVGGGGHCCRRGIWSHLRRGIFPSSILKIPLLHQWTEVPLLLWDVLLSTFDSVGSAEW